METRPTPPAAPDAAQPAAKTPILCVDDEPNVLAGLTLNLGRKFAVEVAANGPAGLEKLAAKSDIAVVVSDFRMPGMDGATFLGRVREQFPDVVRVMLTGQGDVSVAVAAVNQGEIFRFLAKPCPAPLLLGTVQAAVEQHRLITAERVLLQDTLLGSIKAMTEVLALANPAAFGRSMRVKRLVGDLAGHMRLRARWQAEIAAMVSHLAFVTLADEIVQKLHFGQALAAGEQRMVNRLPELTDRLLAHIPRLEGVRDIIAMSAQMAHGEVTEPERGFDDQVLMGAHMLRAAIDWDVMEAQGLAAADALRIMKTCEARYTPEVLHALQTLRGEGRAAAQESADDAASAVVAEVPVAGMRVGMILAQDLRAVAGQLLAARGHEVTESFIRKLENFAEGTLPPRILVVTRVESTKARATSVALG